MHLLKQDNMAGLMFMNLLFRHYFTVDTKYLHYLISWRGGKQNGKALVEIGVKPF